MMNPRGERKYAPSSRRTISATIRMFRSQGRGLVAGEAKKNGFQVQFRAIQSKQIEAVLDQGARQLRANVRIQEEAVFNLPATLMLDVHRMYAFQLGQKLPGPGGLGPDPHQDGVH